MLIISACQCFQPILTPSLNAVNKYLQAMEIHTTDAGPVPSDGDIEDYEKLLEVSSEWDGAMNQFRMSTQKKTGNPRAVKAMLGSLNA